MTSNIAPSIGYKFAWWPVLLANGHFTWATWVRVVHGDVYLEG